MRACVVTILAFTLLSTSVFGQYKYIQKLGSLATIAMPDTPKLIEKGDSKIYGKNYRGVVFFAQTGDVTGNLKDLFNKNNNDSLYNAYLKGMVQDTKGTIFYKNKLKVGDWDGIEFGYEAIFNGQKTFRYHRLVALNDTLLMCGIWASDSLSKDDKSLLKFFEGFKIKSKEQLSLDHASQLGHKTGEGIGTIIAISIPLLLGFGIVLLIKKMVYRKDKPTQL